MSSKGSVLQPARISSRLVGVDREQQFETRDFAAARDKRRAAAKAAKLARRKQRRK